MSKTTDQLKELAALLDRGLLTREEFEREKRKVLGPPTRDEFQAKTAENITNFSDLSQSLATDPDGSATTDFVGVGTTYPQSIGAYRILDVVGEGGMGRVFRARHRSEALAMRQGGDVALKVLHEQYARKPAIAQRFEREAELGIKLDHPCVVRVLQLIMDRGQVALVMELVRGRQINDIYRSANGPAHWQDIRHLFAQLLNAVEHAHDQGVIHRDLKPDNVMITADDQVKVLDFGIAKDLEDGVTQTGLGMGTVDYMAPEQYTNAKHVGKTADIYALGVMLYQLLSARLPWNSGESKFTIMEQKKIGDFPSPLEFSSDIPAYVAEAIEKCILPDPLSRPATASVLRDMLRIPLASSGLNLEAESLTSSISDPSDRNPLATQIESPSAMLNRNPGQSLETGSSNRTIWLSLTAVLGVVAVGYTGWLLGGSSSNNNDQSETNEPILESTYAQGVSLETKADTKVPAFDDARAQSVPSESMVCEHYCQQFDFEGTDYLTKEPEFLEDCVAAFETHRTDEGDGVWAGFSICALKTSDVDQFGGCYLDHFGGVDSLPAPILDEEKAYRLFYSQEAMDEAEAWVLDEAQWAEWRFKKSQTVLEIYNAIQPAGIRIQFSKYGQGWFFVQTTADSFALFPELWTDKWKYGSLGVTEEDAESLSNNKWKYGKFLINIADPYMYICHADTDWCLKFHQGSNGYASLYDEFDELMLFSDSMAHVITDWSGKEKPK